MIDNGILLSEVFTEPNIPEVFLETNLLTSPIYPPSKKTNIKKQEPRENVNVPINELTDKEWKRIMQFIGGVVAKMIHTLPWNVRSPMTFDDWIQIASLSICKMHRRDKCPNFGTEDYFKLAATYIKQEIRNEIQKLTTKGRDINATENEVEVDACTFSSEASLFEPDARLREGQSLTAIESIAENLSSTHYKLLTLLLEGYTRSDFLTLCKILKLEPKVLNEIWSELQTECKNYLRSR